MQKPEQMKVSIIMPVYNGEKYLRECLESLVKQTYSRLEIVLVNDGSTDHSLEICQEYAGCDERIVIVDQDNEGVTVARKAGVKVATGEYIYFVDCDDWLDEDAVNRLVEEAVNYQADIVVAGFTQELNNNGRGKRYGTLEEGVYGAERKEELYGNMFYSNAVDGWGIWPTLWAKLFKKELIAESLERVDTRIFYGEDAACLFTACFQADKLVVIRSVDYHYRFDSAISVSRRRNKDLLDNLFYLHEYLYGLFSEQEDHEKLLEQLRYYMVSLMNHAGELLFDIPYHLCQGEWMKREVEKWKQLLLEKKYTEIRWAFPFYELNGARKIVLYGAGGVGKAYFYQIQANADCEIVAWVDQCIDKERNVIGVENIVKYEYDCVVIAILKDELIDDVIKTLIALGVERTKIIWKKPVRVKNCYLHE